MRPSRTLSRLVLAALVSSAAASSAEAAVFRNVANVRPGHVAWIYSQPDSSSRKLGYLKAGALRVQTLGCQRLAAGGWCHVVRRATRGWVQDRFLKADNLMRG